MIVLPGLINRLGILQYGSDDSHRCVVPCVLLLDLVRHVLWFPWRASVGSFVAGWTSAFTATHRSLTAMGTSILSVVGPRQFAMGLRGQGTVAQAREHMPLTVGASAGARSKLTYVVVTFFQAKRRALFVTF